MSRSVRSTQEFRIYLTAQHISSVTVEDVNYTKQYGLKFTTQTNHLHPVSIMVIR